MERLFLNAGTKPRGLQVNTFSTRFGIDNVFIGDEIRIPFSEFFEQLVEFALTNTVLKQDDPRLAFVEKMHMIKVIEAEGGKRLVFPTET